jgi:hypothetical protein
LATNQTLVENFAHQDVVQTTLQQLQNLQPSIEFSVKLNQVLMHVDPTMFDSMKLFFLWRRLRHDLVRRFRNQALRTFHNAIQIAQIIEVAEMQNIIAPPTFNTTLTCQVNSGPSPMEICPKCPSNS